jgi:hypothetical protein
MARKRKRWTLFNATHEEYRIYQDFFNGFLVSFAIFALIGITIGLAISWIFENVLFVYMMLSMPIVMTYAMMFGATQMWRFMDMKENRGFAQRFRMTHLEYAFITIVIVITLIALLVFDLEQYNNTTDQKRQYEFMLLSTPLLGGIGYTIARGYLPTTPPGLRLLRHYLIPVLLSWMGFSAGFVIIGSSFIGFLLFAIIVGISEGKVWRKVWDQPVPWDLRDR